MRANELMIGDWVDFYHPYEPEKKIITRHRIIDTFECGLVGISDHYNPVHADHIEPVKITPEILEKNLATEPQITWCVGWNKKDDIHVEINREDLNASFYGVIDFVHQLQHALKLCGIEKTIEL
jgi:hypothetical protein